MNEYVAGLRAFARTDDAATLHQIHQPAGLGEPDSELALQHRRRPELGRDDELSRLTEHVEVVADLGVDLTMLARRGPHVLAVGRIGLPLAVPDDSADLGLRDESPLDTRWLAHAHRQG